MTGLFEEISFEKQSLGAEKVRAALPRSGASGLLSFRGLAESVTLCLKQGTEGQVTI